MIVTVATLFTGGLILSVGLGLLTGYLGGWVDSLVMRVGDVVASIPTIFMLILINATLKNQVHNLGREFEELTGIGGVVKSGAPDYFLVFAALTLFSWVGTARSCARRCCHCARRSSCSRPNLSARRPDKFWSSTSANVSNTIIVGLSMGLAGIAGSRSS
jgi:hypothetical protein